MAANADAANPCEPRCHAYGLGCQCSARPFAEKDGIREAVAEMVRDHTMPPDKGRRGHDYRAGWWDAVTYLDSLVKRRVREARVTPSEVSDS